MTKVRGLCLRSTATRNPEGTAWGSSRDPSWERFRSTGASDNCPVLAQRGRTTSEQGAFPIDRERFTPARRSCREPDPFSWKGPMRRTVSLWRTRVPKPQENDSTLQESCQYGTMYV